MPRAKRIWYPGATYHVMSRGNRKISIFQEDGDYMYFLKCLGTVKERYPFDLHAICLMTNHFHMLLTTGSDELWKIMQKLLSIYAEKYNHKYDFSGQLFEGRYTSKIIEDEYYFMEVSRYIHLNPVKAGMVMAPADYEYSSYASYMGAGKDLDFRQKNGNSKIRSMIGDLTTTSHVLGAFQDNNSELYRTFVEEKISHTEHEQQIQKDMKEDDMWLPKVAAALKGSDPCGTLKH
ncbi:MAG: transposase [Lachnospiraceae bacterium]|nr:transposase [Lachnospiraceae bacterium]